MKIGSRIHIPVVIWLLCMPIIAILLWCVGYLLQMTIDPYFFIIIIASGIAIVAAVSLNIINGFTGLFSLGHAGFMLVGAYASAVITMDEYAHPHIVHFMQSLHIPNIAQGSFVFALALIIGAIAASIAGLFVGLLSLRLRGDYLAIATLGLGEGIRAIFINIPVLHGAYGLHNLPSQSSLGNFVWVFLAVAGVIVMSRNLALSSHGRALFAIREDELAAQAVGINTSKYKVLSFVIGAAWAGIAGALLAHVLTQNIAPNSYGFLKSVECVLMVVLGGLGSITGSVIAAVSLTCLPELLRPVKDYQMVFYSILLILLMLLRPQGLFGRKEFGLAALFGRGRHNANPPLKQKGVPR